MWQCHMFLFSLLEIPNYLSYTWHMTHEPSLLLSSLFVVRSLSSSEITICMALNFTGSVLCSFTLYTFSFLDYLFIYFFFLLETLWFLFMFIKLLIKWNMKYRILCIFCLFMDLLWEKLCFIDYISKVKFLLGLYFHDKDLHVRW
jgi:hypothetical protein